MEVKNIAKLDQYIQQGLDGKSAETIKTYRVQLEKFEQYIKHLTNKGRAASMVNLAYNAIHGFANWPQQQTAVENTRVVIQMPILQRVPKSLERNDRNRLLRLVEQPFNKRDMAIVTVFLYCGLRVSELVALNISDVKLKRSGVVHVNQNKGNKQRIVPVTAEAKNRVQEYLQERGECLEDEPLFLSNHGQRISVRTVEHMLKQLGDEFHPHRLRHSFVRELLNKGVDLLLLRQSWQVTVT